MHASLKLVHYQRGGATDDFGSAQLLAAFAKHNRPRINRRRTSARPRANEHSGCQSDFIAIVNCVAGQLQRGDRRDRCQQAPAFQLFLMQPAIAIFSATWKRVPPRRSKSFANITASGLETPEHYPGVR